MFDKMSWSCGQLSDSVCFQDSARQHVLLGQMTGQFAFGVFLDCNVRSWTGSFCVRIRIAFHFQSTIVAIHSGHLIRNCSLFCHLHQQFHQSWRSLYIIYYLGIMSWIYYFASCFASHAWPTADTNWCAVALVITSCMQVHDIISIS